MLPKNELRLLKEKFLELTGFDEKQFEQFLAGDSRSVQLLLTPLLRKAAVEHLRYEDGVVARAFRGEYSAVAMAKNDYNSFLDQQAQNREWGTYLEATALGEKLGCNIVVTYQRAGKEDSTWCLYKKSDIAPTIHLCNTENIHWYSDKQTIGDGNCLFNAVAQILQKLLRMNKPEKRLESTSLTQQGMFKSNFAVDDVVKSQAAIVSVLGKQLTPVQLEDSLKKQKQDEANRLSALNPAERTKVEKQIQEDYQLALKLAREEMNSSSKQFTCRSVASSK